MLKHWRITTCTTAIAIVTAIFLSACGGSTTTTTTTTSTTSGTPGAYNCVQGSIVAAGSTALAPLVQAVATDYQGKCSGANITVNLGGSGAGLTQSESGTIDVGNSDIFRKTSIQPDLVDHQVAVVIFALIINSKVTGVTSLTTDQIKGIYNGDTTNWKQVGGPNLPIVVVSRPTTSGTHQTFQNYILNGTENVVGPSSLTTDSTGTVIKNVQQNDGAIGYAATNAAKKSGLTLLKIDGNAPDKTLVVNNTYKFWNIEHMYTKGTPKPLAQALIDYMLSDQGKQEAVKLDFVALPDMQASAIQAHQPA